ncbi:MAG: AEC family transporter [Gammaproteobacteria bacterium]
MPCAGKRKTPLSSVSTSIVLPLFGIMFAGYLAGRFGILAEGGSAVLSRFVFTVSLPALIFVSLSRVPVGEFFHWPFLGALGGGMLAIFCISLVVARLAFRDSLTALGLHGLTAMFSSTAYIGLPVILVVFGDAGLVPGIIGAVITGAVFLPLAIILAEIDKGRDSGMTMAPLIAVFRNPLLLSTAAGLMVSAAGIAIPAPIATFCELLGGAFIPCALFAAGLFIAGCSVKGEVAEIGWLVFAKLLLHPLITWWLAYRVFELEGILPAIAVVQAALPSGVPVFVLAQQYNTFVTRSSAVIVVSTALSLFTLSALLVLLER